MEKHSGATKTLGQAIDAIIKALTSLEPSEQTTAIRAACEHLKIRPPESLVSRTESSGQSGVPPPPGTTPSRQVDIRALKEEKQPSSANEMAALVAFYLSELAPERERKTEVQVDDITKYFKQAGFRLPQQPRVLLANARNAGYFDTADHGKYRLNAVGYNLVAHNLPRAKSGETPAPRRKRRKSSSTRGRKKSKK